MTTENAGITLPRSISETNEYYRTKIAIGTNRTCSCKPNSLNCLSGKDWLKSQIGIWQFFYEGRDIRDKKLHPATFPISLAKKVISVFTHEGELVLDPFVGSGTSLVAAQDLNRNAVGFDLQEKYVALCVKRLASNNLSTEVFPIFLRRCSRIDQLPCLTLERRSDPTRAAVAHKKQATQKKYEKNTTPSHFIRSGDFSACGLSGSGARAIRF